MPSPATASLLSTSSVRLAAFFALAVPFLACHKLLDLDNFEVVETSGTGGQGGVGGVGGTGAAVGGQGGTGGIATACTPACVSPLLCDIDTGTCVACADDTHCEDITAAKCSTMNECEACTERANCTGLAGTEACDVSTGTCVACTADDATACTAMQTCDVESHECVDVAEDSLTPCQACSNDLQCAGDARCVPMDFAGSFHGNYCLKLPSSTCDRPFQVAINQPSLNGDAATNYCGINQAKATCEVVLALLDSFDCPAGVDGRCTPLGGMEMDVPGAVCRSVGVAGDKCTYECTALAEYPAGGAATTCGTDGNNTPPGWCGG